MVGAPPSGGRVLAGLALALAADSPVSGDSNFAAHVGPPGSGDLMIPGPRTRVTLVMGQTTAKDEAQRAPLVRAPDPVLKHAPKHPALDRGADPAFRLRS